MTVSGSHNTITFKPSISNLTADVGVRLSDNHTVFGGIILVLILNDKSLSCIVIGLSFTAPAKLDLEPLEVGLALYHLDKCMNTAMYSCLLYVCCIIGKILLRKT